MLAAATTVQILDTKSMGQVPSGSTGYGGDPNLMAGKIYWDRIMTSHQLRTTAVLTDILLPHVDEKSPSASELKVPDFIDEWISAPYETQRNDRMLIIDGLAWIDRETQLRFGRDFYEATASEQLEICDDICYRNTAKLDFELGSRFFTKFRNLTLGGYYTSEVGMRDVGYVGNVALATFDGPPQEVLEQLGIDEVPW